jgi:hypothetical protein
VEYESYRFNSLRVIRRNSLALAHAVRSLRLTDGRSFNKNLLFALVRRNGEWRIVLDAPAVTQEAAATARGSGPRNEFSGIGAKLKLSGGGVLIERVFPGSPAEKAGLKSREQILEVDGRSVIGKPLRNVVTRIVGPAGTEVRLRVAGEHGRTREVVVTRGKIDLAAKSAADFLGSYVVPGRKDTEVRITHVEGDVYRAECAREHWTATGVIYCNPTHKTYAFKGYCRMGQSVEVHSTLRGVVGFVTIGYQGPGTLILMRAWNLKGGAGSDVSSQTLIRRQGQE